MVVDPSPNWIVKIADFGISKRRQQDVTLSQTANRGTIGYAAPEVLGIGLDSSREVDAFAADMWSLGAVAYCLLTQHKPFPNLTNLIQYATGKEDFPGTPLVESNVSDNGQDFVRRLLAHCPDIRLSSSAASYHPWLQPCVLAHQSRPPIEE